MNAAPGVVAVALVTLATLLIGTWGLRFSRTTSDFFVASRTVRPTLNASAIGGEYLSAASFLGVAGLVDAVAGRVAVPGQGVEAELGDHGLHEGASCDPGMGRTRVRDRV